MIKYFCRWRHNIQHNDTQHNDTQHNNKQRDTQHNNKNVTLSITALGTQCCYDECHLSSVSFMLSVVMMNVIMLSVTNKRIMLSDVMLNVVMLSFIMLSVRNKPIMLSVVMLSVVAPYRDDVDSLVVSVIKLFILRFWQIS